MRFVISRRNDAKARSALVALFVCSLASACGSPKSPTNPDPVGTTSRLTAVIEGVRWTATRPTWSETLGLTRIGGIDSQGTFMNLTISGIAPGRYPIGAGEDSLGGVLYVEGGMPGVLWTTGLAGGGNGEVVITHVTSTEIHGSFNFVLQPMFTSGGGTLPSARKVVTQGEFVIVR
jgi:Family of unknown function (DUF6252)